MRECPYCKELVKDDALVCPHCTQSIQAWDLQQRVNKNAAGMLQLFGGILILMVVLGVGIVVLLYAFAWILERFG